MKRFVKFSAVILAVCSAFMLTSVSYADSVVPDYSTKESISSAIDKSALYLSCQKSKEKSVKNISVDSGAAESFELKLFGFIPVKTVQAASQGGRTVKVLGQPFGVKLFTDGVMVSRVTSFKCEGKNLSPAKSAGICAGDYITTLNGVRVYDNDEVENIVKNSNGRGIAVEFSHNGAVKRKTVYPKLSDDDGNYHIGMWVRDSSAGIGTLTFYDPLSNVTAALGHGLYDPDTAALVSVNSGSLVCSEIIDIKKSSNGVAGELCGCLTDSVLSQAVKNSENGIYALGCDNDYAYCEMPLSYADEVKTGSAEILTTVDGATPRLFKCQIIKICDKRSATRNMVVEITDPKLLKLTGGIVQGQSGSPVIQNGKLVGALTHMFVDDCAKGYAIFAENMLSEADKASVELKKR